MRWFLIFSFLTLSSGLFSSACEVKIIPPSIVVRYGDRLSANCTSSLCSGVTGFGWESPVAGVGPKMGISSLTLNVETLKTWEIAPMCYIMPSQLTKILQVTVYKMPESVTMSQAPSTMVAGQQYLIECHVNNVAPVNKLSVFWLKGNETIHTETFNKSGSSPQNVTSNINLTAKRDDNENEISCQAKLNLWPDERGLPPMKSESRRMTVLYPPTFMKPANETVDTPANGNISLNCTAAGNPMPTYQWHFSNPEQEKISKQQANMPVLSLSFLLQGSYSCTASNSQGSSTKYFTVTETSETPTTLIAIVIAAVCVGALLAAGGLYYIKQDGTFPFIQQCRSEVI